MRDLNSIMKANGQEPSELFRTILPDGTVINPHLPMSDVDFDLEMSKSGDLQAPDETVETVETDDHDLLQSTVMRYMAHIGSHPRVRLYQRKSIYTGLEIRIKISNRKD